MSDGGPIRYCLITSSYSQADGANRTGWATYAETMAACLRAGGAEVTVAVIHEAMIDPPMRVNSPATVHIQLHWTYPLSRYFPGIAEGLQLLREIRRLDRTHHFDVIEGPNIAGLCWALAVWYRRRFMLRVHTSLVSPRGERPRRRTLKRRFKWQLDAFTGRSAHQVVTHSLSHATTVAKQFGIPVEQIALVPHAVTDVGLAPPADPRRILAIAGPARRKGVDVLLASFARVLEQVPDAELVIVGTTPTSVEQMIHYSGLPPTMGSRVHALGPLSDSALAEEWNRAGVAVVPSRYESFGLVAVEAMARGRPLIVANGGALGEVVGDGGIVVPIEDPAAMAQALVSVIQSPEQRAELGAAARKRYEELYLPAVLTRRMNEVIAPYRQGA